MAKKSGLAALAKAWREADDYTRQITGKRLGELLGRTFDLYGEDILEKAGVKEAKDAEDKINFADPYFILDVRKGARDSVVKGAYRILAREYHPDTGKKPDPKMFQKVTEAYQKIMAERKDKEAAKNGG